MKRRKEKKIPSTQKEKKRIDLCEVRVLICDERRRKDEKKENVSYPNNVLFPIKTLN